VGANLDLLFINLFFYLKQKLKFPTQIQTKKAKGKTAIAYATAIFLVVSISILGIEISNTPSFVLALISSLFTLSGRVKDLWNFPKLDSIL